MMVADLCLRVNGIDIGSVKVRRKLEAGSPMGGLEVAVTIPSVVRDSPPLGELVLDDSFKIEVCEHPGQGGKWQAITARALLAKLTLG